MSVFRNFFTNLKFIINTRKRNKDILIFDSWFGEKFADNPRYLYQFLTEHKEEYHLKNVVWITKNEELCAELNSIGYEAYLMESQESKYYHQIAGYQFCNNVAIDTKLNKGEFLPQYSFGAKRINLWHGSGIFKAFGKASNEYLEKTKNIYLVKNYIMRNSRFYRTFFDSIGGWSECFFLTTSKNEMRKMKKSFLLPDKNFIISGYPRNVYKPRLLENEKDVLKIIDSYKIKILYLPTFRTGTTSFDSNILSRKIEETFSNDSVLLVQKQHSASSCVFEKNELAINILNLNSNFDVNVITPYVDIVITDYSSILADALYHYVPVLLYTPDYNEYVRSSRGLTADAEFILSAGVRFYCVEDLVEFLKSNINCLNSLYSNSYKQVRNYIWGDKNYSMDDIWKDILEQSR